jgi:predicted DCC family thiol-disulfide oxidoreductase YuxK
MPPSVGVGGYVDPVAELTVLYDEGCGFCTLLARRLARSPRLAVAPIGSPLGSVLLRDLTPAERYAAVHVVDALGRRFTGGGALAPLARTFRGGTALAVAFDAFPAVTEHAYGVVARNRGLASRAFAILG